MNKQEYKVTTKLGDVFFFAHSMKTAYHHAKVYLDKHAEGEAMLYRVNDNNIPAARWILVR
jgi:hypothetical protein